MATLQQVQDDLTATKTALDSLDGAITSLQQQLAAVLSGQLPPAVQAQVDAIFAQAEDTKAKALDDLAKAQPVTPPTP
jgi:hypothetical protein